MNHRGNLSELLRTLMLQECTCGGVCWGAFHDATLLHSATHGMLPLRLLQPLYCRACLSAAIVDASVNSTVCMRCMAGAVCAVVAVMNSLILTPLVRGPQGPMNTPMLTFLSTCCGTHLKQMCARVLL
jgi:hypothetical protein